MQWSKLPASAAAASADAGAKDDTFPVTNKGQMSNRHESSHLMCKTACNGISILSAGTHQREIKSVTTGDQRDVK